MKRIHILEGTFNRLYETYDGIDDVDESTFEAGTDFPRYYDAKEDVWYEATWNGEYAFPFGYWNDGDGYVFSVGDAWSTHANAFGKVMKIFLKGIFREYAYEDASILADELESLNNDIRNYGYTYNEDTDCLISEDGSDEISIVDWCAEHEDGYLYDSLVRDCVMEVIEDGECADAEEIFDRLYDDSEIESRSYHTQEDVEEALKMYGYDFHSLFEDGFGMGRIWPNLEIISFYESEQPDPEAFQQILRDLSNVIREDYDDLLYYHIIFRDFDNGDRVTACTVSDYIQGNYGDEENSEERERTYGDGNTKFIPHLASPEEKKRLGIFKDFQNNRDAKWAPRLKGFNGNMAAYRAARYPYTDNKKILGNIINEIIDKVVKNKNGQPN